MDIVIGATPRVGVQEKKRRGKGSQVLEGRVLDMRDSRKPYGVPPNGTGERRFKRNGPDPSNSRVVTLLVPDGYSLPRDAGSGNLKVFMRFVPDRQKTG
jgi:hypothetical protein